MASDTTDYSNAANLHKVRAAVLHIRHTIWNIWNHNSTDVRFLASLDGHVHFMTNAMLVSWQKKTKTHAATDGV